MDIVIIITLICAFVGLVVQNVVKVDSIRWLTVCVGTVAMIMVLESGWESVAAVTGLSVSAAITVIYSLHGLLYGGTND